jgi:hypothetical protein
MGRSGDADGRKDERDESGRYWKGREGDIKLDLYDHTHTHYLCWFNICCRDFSCLMRT